VVENLFFGVIPEFLGQNLFFLIFKDRIARYSTFANRVESHADGYHYERNAYP